MHIRLWICISVNDIWELRKRLLCFFLLTLKVNEWITLTASLPFTHYWEFLLKYISEHLRASVWIIRWYYMPWSPFEFFIDTPTSRRCETWALHVCIFKQFPERCNYAAILSLLLVLHKLKICLNLNVNVHQINSLIYTGTYKLIHTGVTSPCNAPHVASHCVCWRLSPNQMHKIPL